MSHSQEWEVLGAAAVERSYAEAAAYSYFPQSGLSGSVRQSS